MKYFALVLALLASPVWGQDDEQHIPVKHPEIGKWGIIDINGDWILPPRFEAAVRFSEGLAVAKDQGKFGYIDESGAWVLKPSLEDARSFSEGLAALKYDGKWGYVDANFDWVIGPSFEFAREFKNGHAIVRTTKGEGIISRENWVFKPDTPRSLGCRARTCFCCFVQTKRAKSPPSSKG